MVKDVFLLKGKRVINNSQCSSTETDAKCLELFIELSHKDGKGTIICIQIGEFSQTEHTDVTRTQTEKQTTSSMAPRGHIAITSSKGNSSQNHRLILCACLHVIL